MDTIFRDIPLLIIASIVIIVTVFTILYTLLVGLPNVLRDRRAVMDDAEAPLTARIFSSQQVFVMIAGLLCLLGFLVAAVGAISIESLLVRSYITRISLLVAVLAISATILSVSVSRQRIRNAREIVVTEPIRDDIRQTRATAERIEDRLDDAESQATIDRDQATEDRTEMREGRDAEHDSE